jgi:hypothetical protein
MSHDCHSPESFRGNLSSEGCWTRARMTQWSDKCGFSNELVGNSEATY